MRLGIVCGTRPEAIKVAPLYQAAQRDSAVQPVFISTGQHGQVLQEMFSWFGITPDYTLELNRATSSLNELYALIVTKMQELFLQLKLDAVVVQGDTTTVSATAVAAANLQVPVIHLEAGLRSGNIASPFPEELNRRVVSAVASLHLTPTSEATSNLDKENINPAQITQCGNTVIDALIYTANKPVQLPAELAWVDDTSQRVVLVTCHRRENWGQPLRDITEAVHDIAEMNPDVEIIWPVHPNPRIRETVSPIINGHPRIHLTEPLSYPLFSHLLSRAYMALTDSGGVQEEAPTLHTPVLVMRDTTERPEGVEIGCAKLVGFERDALVKEANLLLSDQNAYAQMLVEVNPYGDGHAAEYALESILQHFQK